MLKILYNLNYSKKEEKKNLTNTRQVTASDDKQNIKHTYIFSSS